MNSIVERLDYIIEKFWAFEKAPPGPKPDRYGDHIIWDEDNRRWIDPNKSKTGSKTTKQPLAEKPPATEELTPETPAKEDTIQEPGIRKPIPAPGTYPAANFERKPGYIDEWLQQPVLGFITDKKLHESAEKALADFDPSNAPSRLDTEEIKASGVDVYMAMNGNYDEVNTLMRKGGTSPAIERMMSYMKLLEEPQILYRGVGHKLRKNLKPGSKMTLDQFTSTSRSPSTAMAFSFGEDKMPSALFEIHAGPNTVGMTIDDNYARLYEDETILDSAQILIIEDIQERPFGESGQVESSIQIIKARIGYEDFTERPPAKKPPAKRAPSKKPATKKPTPKKPVVEDSRAYQDEEVGQIAGIKSERVQTALDAMRSITLDDRRKEGFPDVGLREYATLRWGEQQAQIVDGDTFDKIEGTPFFRGITKADHLDRNIGPGFVGIGLHGNGQYYSPKLQEAKSYGSPEKNGWVHSMKLSPDANIATIADVNRLKQEHQARRKQYKKAEFDFFDDIGRLLATAGYDGYISSYEGYAIMYNKKAMIIDGRTLPDGEWGREILAVDQKDRGKKVTEVFRRKKKKK